MRAATAVLAAACATGCAAELRCIAEPNRSSDDLGYALSIVCDPRHLDCSAINEGGAQYWPNTIYAHSNWAFDKYWKTVGKRNASFCDGTAAPSGIVAVPHGQAAVFNCSDECTTCQMKNGTSEQAAHNVTGYLCGSNPAILGPLCAPIKEGGSLTKLPLLHQASYVANLYYQPTKCDLSTTGCDFSGHGEVVPCCQARDVIC